MNFAKVVYLLQEKKYTISTMESCTGGGVANAITNIPGASDILKFSAVTYSNEFKIKMGVNKETIAKYSVYSIEVAKEMSQNIAKFTASTFGIGITGKLNREDKANLHGSNNQVFVSIYNSLTNEYYPLYIEVKDQSRALNKKLIITSIIKELLRIINQ